MMEAVRHYFRELVHRFGAGWNAFWYTPADPYVLGAIRIATGATALVWLLSYTPDLTRFFGPSGLLPPDTVARLLGPDSTTWSYFRYFSSPAELLAMHALGVVVLLAFTLGWFTRVMAVASLIVVLSTVHRGPMLTGQAEPILSMVLFYLCLGPCGACLSVDAWWARHRASRDAPTLPVQAPRRLVSARVSIRLIQVHICVVYLMMGIAKVAEPSDTWWAGDAVWWLAAKPESRLVDLTPLLSRQIYLVNAWTHGITLFELAFPLLIWNRLARPLLLAVAVPMWCATALLTGLIVFSMMMLVATAAFVDFESLRDRRGPAGALRESVPEQAAAADA